MQHVRSSALIMALSFTSWIVPARATVNDSDKEAIRTLANEAGADYDQGRYEAAREKALRAYSLAKVPRLALLAARTHQKLDQLVQAYELYRQAVSLERNELWLGNVQEQAQVEATRELAALQPRLPKLVVVVQGAASTEVTIAIDGIAVPSALVGLERYVNPGRLLVVGEYGQQQLREQATLAEGERKQVVLRFTPAPTMALGAAAPVAVNQPVPPAQPVPIAPQPAQPPPPAAAPPPHSLPLAPPSNNVVQPGNNLRLWGWVGVGVGAAGLVLGTVSGLVVQSKHASLESNCGTELACDPARESEVNSYNQMRTLSTIGFVVGGLGAAAGVTLLLVAPKQESRPGMALWMGPGSMGLRGAF